MHARLNIAANSLTSRNTYRSPEMGSKYSKGLRQISWWEIGIANSAIKGLSQIRNLRMGKGTGAWDRELECTEDA